VVETQKANYTPSALSSVYCYNATAKKRSFYGVPYLQASLLNHICCPLVEKAGAKVEDIPKTWDARYDFFKGLQKKLREQGMRNTFGVGFTVSSVGVDTNDQLNQFVIACGGGNLVGKDGRLHLDDPAVRKAVIGALTSQTTAYKQGFVPPGAINWNDSDNNKAFHAKRVIMDIDGTISTEVAIIKKQAGLRRHPDHRPAGRQRWQAGAGPGQRRLRPDPEGRQEHRRRLGFSQIPDRAEELR
jgi:multiple sugar transport system substrate-binding protein